MDSRQRVQQLQRHRSQRAGEPGTLWLGVRPAEEGTRRDAGDWSKVLCAMCSGAEILSGENRALLDNS